jgi:Protein of unknown function (DUF1759)
MDHRTLINERKSIKSKFDRISNLIELELNDLDKSELEAVQVYQEELVNIFENYTLVQNKIENYLPKKNEHLSPDEEDMGKVATEFYRTRSQLVKAIKKLSSNDESSISQHKPNVSELNYCTPTDELLLPKINIPTFDGNFADWLQFFDLFKSLVDENPRYTDIQKFHYLRNSLKGKPYELISQIKVTSANYKLAMNTLTERFDNKVGIVNSHLKNMLNTKPLDKYNCQAVRNLVDIWENNLTSIKNLGLSTEEILDLILIHLFKQKLDNFTKKSFDNARDVDTLPTLDEFFKHLKHRCKISESDWQFENSHEKKFKVSLHTNTRATRGICSSYPPSYHNRDNNQIQNFAQNTLCSYCNNSHKIYTCEQFNALSPAERLKFIRQKQYCANC